MVSRISCLLTLALALGNPIIAQVYPAAFQRAAELGFPQLDETGAGQTTNSDSGTGQNVTWKTVFPNILKDQKRTYWDFPRDLAHGKHWIPTLSFIAATAGLVALDQFESPYFRRSTTYHGFNSAFSGTNSTIIIAAVPAATYLTGLVTKNRYAQSTALLTGEAIADSEITAEILKVVTRRSRPESIAPNGNFADTFFDSNTLTDGGFPSGHTIAAFSVATIMSRRYGHEHRWVPYAAYGLAGTIGFSRVTLSAHNVSDVLVGAALGYVISRFVVLAQPH